jgi:DNA helicase IV
VPHPDLEFEQAHVDRALACLEAMRAATARLIDGEFGGTEVNSAIVRAELEARLRSLSDQSGPLTFGRIDEEDGPRHHIGRRHVKDRDDEPVVVDWRAPIAAPFYRATIPQRARTEAATSIHLRGTALARDFRGGFRRPGLGRRRARRSAGSAARRARTHSFGRYAGHRGDHPGRAGRDHSLAGDLTGGSAGGPGNGKTAVGLHRAAFLLYEHRIELERDGVLVVGPNPAFLEYISGCFRP